MEIIFTEDQQGLHLDRTNLRSVLEVVTGKPNGDNISCVCGLMHLLTVELYLNHGYNYETREPSWTWTVLLTEPKFGQHASFSFLPSEGRDG